MVKNIVVFHILVLFTAVLGSPLSHPIQNSSIGLIRIVGGQSADIADYPYQVSLMVDNQHSCGGSILTATFVLTAAHCFNEENRPSHLSVRVGSSQRTSGGQTIKIQKIYIHPKFDDVTFDYDSAVVQLASALTFGKGIQPIQLAGSSTKIVNGGISIATGWGLTTNDGKPADQLQVVTLPLITTKKCQSNYYQTAVTSRMFCAGTAGKDTCIGDSGGPLVANGLQIGIVSWGDVCGNAATPGVYTKIMQILSFINSIVK